MAVISQRDGVRVAAFQKCGHTSITNMFLTPAGVPIQRGSAPAVRNSGDEAAAIGAYRGDVIAAQGWPTPHTTVAFFRDPFWRAVSAYEHFIIRTLSDVDGVPTLGRKVFTDLGFKPGMTFAGFCSHLLTIDLVADNHLKPQSISFGEVACGNLIISPLESLRDVWPVLVKHLNLDCTSEVIQYNKGGYVRAKYDTENAKIIRDLYSDDYKLWGGG